LLGGLRGDLWEGDAIGELEQRFAEFTGVPDAVAVPSGRAGLRFILSALQLEPGSEVICSAFGYPVVPHLVRSLGYRLRFVDCEMETLGMDPDKLASEISDRTRAVIATHLYGVPCRISEIARVADAHGAALIEDCAHCLGASEKNRRVGSFGRFGYFSFETSKPINTLGGGIVTTRERGDAARIREIAGAEPDKGLSWLLKRLMKTSFEATVTHPLVFNVAVYPALRLLQGRDSTEDRYASGYQRDEITMTGRMGRYSNYQADLGLRQMDQAVARLERRVANAERLIDRLRGRVRFQVHDGEGVRSNYMLVAALVAKMPEVARELLKLGVDTKHDYMRDCSRLLGEDQQFPGAARAEREVLHLPAYPELSDAQIDRIADAVARCVDHSGPAEKTVARAS
jgi:dTDP-4-amino-4,6-dideoxygalactose transaminase